MQSDNTDKIQVSFTRKKHLKDSAKGVIICREAWLPFSECLFNVSFIQ